MDIFIAVILFFILFAIFSLFGHITLKLLSIKKEDNVLINLLVHFAFGSACFLFLTNLIGNLTSSFIAGITIPFIIFLLLAGLRYKELVQIISDSKTFLQNNFLNSIKNRTDRFFWLLLGFTNLLYGITAFSSNKINHTNPASGHIFNINQLSNGNYPLHYSYVPHIEQNIPHGADILGALISKFSGLNPEITLDLFTILFLNLSFLIVFALVTKFIETEKINRYLTIFAVFFFWAPISIFFLKGSFEGQNLLEKLIYVSQTKLKGFAEWSGPLVHWFFDPIVGISLFFTVVGVYLLFNFFQGNNNLLSAIALAIYLSSIVILDPNKYIILMAGLLIYIIVTVILPLINSSKKGTKIDSSLINIGAILLLSIVFGIIQGNLLNIGGNLTNISFGINKALLNDYLNPLKTNIVLMIIFAFGFYQAYEQKNKWVNFVLIFFIGSIVSPHIISLPNTNIASYFSSANVLGAFSLPFAIKLGLNQFKLVKENLAIFYTVIFVVFSICSFFIWAFGGDEKPLFINQEGKITYSNIQTLPFESEKNKGVINYLRSHGSKNSAILAEPEYARILSLNTGLYNLVLPENITVEQLAGIKQEDLERYNGSYQGKFYPFAFTFDKKVWVEQKVKWLYISQRLFKFIMNPFARVKLLNAYLNKGAKLAYSNKLETDPLKQFELYKIDANHLNNSFSKNSKEELSKILISPDAPLYIKQIALSPYLGVYSSMSNDYNGDNISDIAFYDELNKKWHIIYGSNFKEEEIDLYEKFFANYKKEETFIPIPGDYDGDSITDIALFNRNLGFWNIYNSLGDYVSGKAWGGHIGEIPLPADLDGDSKTDLVVFTSSNTDQVRFPSSLSASNYEYADKFISATPLDIPLIADVDGDKKGDYIIYNSLEFTFNLILSKDFYTSLPVKVKIGSKDSRPVIADYDGDGKADLSTWHPQTGTWEIAYASDILQNKATSSEPFIGCGIQEDSSGACKTTSITFGQIGDIPMPGDYDGDGKDEIAVLHTNTYEFEIHNFNGELKVVDLAKYKNLVPASVLGV